MAVGLHGEYVSMAPSSITQKVFSELDERVWSSGVFICGHPKSGTSLLMTMLDSHPELIVYPEESHFFRRFLPARQMHPQKNIEETARENLLHIFDWNQEDPPMHQEGFPDRDYSKLSAAAIWDYFHQITRENDDPHVALPAAIFSYGIETGQMSDRTRYWVEKTPYNEQYAEKIFQYWPHSKCLHIVRDPRDNYASYKRKQIDWRPEDFAYSWWNSVRSAQKNFERYGLRRYLIIRYEDLVEKPEDNIGVIISFLGIDDDPILRRPTRAGGLWMGNSMFGDNFQSISAKPAGRYLEHLRMDEVSVLESLLKPEMKRLGYLFETASSYPDQLLSWLKRTKWRIQK
jgi:hypothetical protein